MTDKMTFDVFSNNLNSFEKNFAIPLHQVLSQKGYTIQIKPAAQGPVLSYLTPKTKRTIINYVFRKNGMQVRIYGDRSFTYQDFLQTLPDDMVTAINKATDCRDCNTRCNRGYQGQINGKEFFKCRYSAFLFTLTTETAEAIKEFIEREVTAREAMVK